MCVYISVSILKFISLFTSVYGLLSHFIANNMQTLYHFKYQVKIRTFFCITTILLLYLGTLSMQIQFRILPMIPKLPFKGVFLKTGSSQGLCITFSCYNSSIFLFCFVLFFRLHNEPCGISVSRPEIEPVPPALGAWSLNHWTTREVLFSLF